MDVATQVVSTGILSKLTAMTAKGAVTDDVAH
jgi:hypothetical protein